MSEDYPWIRAWGQMMGSRSWYIQDQIQRARETNAPQNATYEIHDGSGRTGKWQTTDTITNPHTRAYLGLPPK